MQLLDAGCKIITETRALWQDGELTIRERAATPTNDLKDFIARFDKALAMNAKHQGLSDEDRGLRALCVK